PGSARGAHGDDPNAGVPRRGAAGAARRPGARFAAARRRREHGGRAVRRDGRSGPGRGVRHSGAGAHPLAPGPRHLAPPRHAAMKFLCVECDPQMTFEERQLPGDGTLAAAFRWPKCGRAVALLTNPMETQLVASLGVKIGGTTLPAQPLETVRGMVATGRDDAFADGVRGPGSRVRWS